MGSYPKSSSLGDSLPEYDYALPPPTQEFLLKVLLEGGTLSVHDMTAPNGS